MKFIILFLCLTSVFYSTGQILPPYSVRWSVSDSLKYNPAIFTQHEGQGLILTYDGLYYSLNSENKIIDTIQLYQPRNLFYVNGKNGVYLQPNAYYHRELKNKIFRFYVESGLHDTIPFFHRNWDIEKIFGVNEWHYLYFKAGGYYTDKARNYKSKTYSRYQKEKMLFKMDQRGKTKSLPITYAMDSVYREMKHIPYKEDIFLDAGSKNTFWMQLEASPAIYECTVEGTVIRSFGQKGKADNSAQFPLKKPISSRELLIYDHHYAVETVSYGPIFYDSVKNYIYRLYQPAVKSPNTIDTGYVSFIYSDAYLQGKGCPAVPEDWYLDYDLKYQRPYYLQIYNAVTGELLKDMQLTEMSQQRLEPYACKTGEILFRSYEYDRSSRAQFLIRKLRIIGVEVPK